MLQNDGVSLFAAGITWETLRSFSKAGTQFERNAFANKKTGFMQTNETRFIVGAQEGTRTPTMLLAST